MNYLLPAAAHRTVNFISGAAQNVNRLAALLLDVIDVVHEMHKRRLPADGAVSAHVIAGNRLGWHLHFAASVGVELYVVH